MSLQRYDVLGSVSGKMLVALRMDTRSRFHPQMPLNTKTVHFAKNCNSFRLNHFPHLQKIGGCRFVSSETCELNTDH